MRGLKEQLRQRLRPRRKALSAAFKEYCGQQIAQTLLQSAFFKQAKHIALYAPFEGEVPTQMILEQALFLQKYCYFPILSGQQLRFAPVDDQTSFFSNRFGILEPAISTNILASKELDLAFVPLVAFDGQGFRLGMGAGYYDRTFAKKKERPMLIGLAYDFQRVSFVPHTRLDVKLDAAITEKQLYVFAGEGARG